MDPLDTTSSAELIVMISEAEAVCDDEHDSDDEEENEKSRGRIEMRIRSNHQNKPKCCALISPSSLRAPCFQIPVVIGIGTFRGFSE